MKDKKELGVYWSFPNEKGNFAQSTVATSDVITVLSEMYLTTIDVYHMIHNDNEAKEILKKYIEKGYGNFVLRDFTHINKNGTYRKIENEQIVPIPLKELNKHLEPIRIIERDKYDYEYE